MKNSILIVVTMLFCLGVGTNIGMAVPMSLGWWAEGVAGSTHQFWDFTPEYIRLNPGDGYTAIPEEVFSPEPEFVLATISPGGSWDGQSSMIGAWIYVSLELPNYDILNPYKEIWVDIGNAVVAPGSIAVSAAGHGMDSTDYICEVLPGQGDAEFGIMIWPNPEIEKIGFMVIGTTGPAVLDYIHVDTICIPEPATAALLGMSFAIVRFHRKYKERS